jgi:hypothetical protein
VTRGNPATPGSTTSENLGAQTASPRALLLGVPGPEPRVTKSKHRSPVVSSSRGSIPSASTLSAPSSVSLATASTLAGVPFKRGAPLPSSACITGTSCAYIISASCADPSSGISSTDSHSTNASWHIIAGYEELGGTLIGSPMLETDDTTRVGCGGVTGHAADR